MVEPAEEECLSTQSMPAAAHQRFSCTTLENGNISQSSTRSASGDNSNKHGVSYRGLEPSA